MWKVSASRGILFTLTVHLGRTLDYRVSDWMNYEVLRHTAGAIAENNFNLRIPHNFMLRSRWFN